MLIDDLKKKHVELANIFLKIKELGISSKEGQEKLLSAKEELLAHLKYEDEHLYPFLRKEAEKDGGLRNLLETFAKDMDRISKSALDFFAKYSNGGSTSEFAKEIVILMSSISKRNKLEEHFLYPEYIARKK
ncbi:MAG: hemerythrin domain-containing protein [Leptospiraceae bacterium]|nr:hemerythrin domain-containing protein [Leptospiraceae bacterium]MCK6381105.1 hemerythrin domain-containing protein [Leptospiraceae bacterium]NUM41948.1 hemerythrin domain-containing protein [Leptospiraceae bacterium]